MKSKLDADATVWDIPIPGIHRGTSKWDGHPDCPHCKGRGVTEHTSDNGMPETLACRCVLKRAVLLNVDRGWKGQALSKAPKIPSSPLLGHEHRNLWVTADIQTLRAHLRYVAVRQGPGWKFNVSSDADLMTAWLASVAVKGQGILDPDAARVSGQDAQLVDLVEPPELLILFLGIKAARNSAMGEVLLEALYHRSNINRPTWVVDQPNQRFDANHLAYSDAARSYLGTWGHVTLPTVGDMVAASMGATGSGTRKLTLPTTRKAPASPVPPSPVVEAPESEEVEEHQPLYERPTRNVNLGAYDGDGSDNSSGYKKKPWKGGKKFR